MQNITINQDKKLKSLNNTYNQIGFITQVLVPKIDVLMETNKPKHAFKKACKDYLRESEKFLNEHYKNFEDFGKIEANDGKTHESLDIYQITAKAYDEAFEFISNRTPNEVVSIMTLINRLEKDGVNLSEINIDYEPIEM